MTTSSSSQISGVGGTTTFLGTFGSVGVLPSAAASTGGYAWVGSAAPYTVYYSNGSTWVQQGLADPSAITADNTGATDASATILAAAEPYTGALVTGKTLEFHMTNIGFYKFTSPFDVDPSINLDFKSRGGTVLIPPDNMAATTANYPGQSFGAGAASAFIRVARRFPTGGANTKQAYYHCVRNVNIDWTGTTQTNAPYTFRIPNANISNNPQDGDPLYTTNKEYTGGCFEYIETWNGPGGSFLFDNSSGRTFINSCRALGFQGHGFEFDNNDIVATGHWGAGNNGQSYVPGTGAGGGFGFKLGAAAGFFGGFGNFWGSSSLRSSVVGAGWILARKMFSLICSEFNDWFRVDGGNQNSFGNGWWRGGNLGHIVFAPFGVNYTSDGIAIDQTFGGADSRLQASAGGITNYQSLNLVGNTYVRTDNPGAGNSGNSCTADSTTDTFTSTAHGLSNGTVVYIYNAVNGAGWNPANQPSPITFPSPYFVVGKTANTFQLSLTLGGSAIDITSNGANLLWTTFPTAYNAGGDLGGNAGTASQYLWDVNTSAMVNEHFQICRSPNVNPYYGIIQTFTVTIASPGVVTATAHGQLNGNRVVLNTTGQLPTGLQVGTVYYVVGKTTNTFQLAATYGGAAINTTGTQSGTHSVAYRASRPVNVHGGSQMNYTIQDAYENAFWVGGSGNSVHSHICLGINESADLDPNYQVEIGDNTGGTTYRNIHWGVTEFDNGPQITDGGWSYSALGNTGTFSTTPPAYAAAIEYNLQGNTYTSGTVTLTGALNSSCLIPILFRNGTINALTVTSTTGAINQQLVTLPANVQGGLALLVWYDRGTDKYILISAQSPVVADIAQSVGSGATVDCPTGTVTSLMNITLTPGTWDVEGTAILTSGNNATVPGSAFIGISTANNTITKTDSKGYTARTYFGAVATTSGVDFDTLRVGVYRVTVAMGSTQQLFLNVNPTYTGASSDVKGWGNLRARPAN